MSGTVNQEVPQAQPAPTVEAPTAPAPIDTASAQENDGEGWPVIWLIVTAVCVVLAVYFLLGAALSLTGLLLAGPGWRHSPREHPRVSPPNRLECQQWIGDARAHGVDLRV